MENVEDILREMRDRKRVRDIHYGVCGNISLNSTKDYLDIIGDFADRIEAAAEERERKLKEEIRGLQDAMGDDTLLMQARDIDRANEEIRRLRGVVSRLFSKRHEEAIRQSEGSRAVIQSLKEQNERLLKIKEEYENAKRNITNLRREVTLKQDRMADMGLAYRNELKRLEDELKSLKAALKPVLECNIGSDPDNYDSYIAVFEAQRIYNENNEGKEVTDGKD